MTHTADIVLFTVNDFETQEVWRAFGKSADAQPNGARTYWNYGEIGGARIVHAQSNMADLAAGEAARDAMDCWRPTLLIAVGIAWGADRDTQAIGDILVADPLVDADYDKRNPPNGDKARGDPFVQNDRLRSIIATCASDRRGGATEAHGALTVGRVLSLPTLIDDIAERKRLIKAHPGAIGGEMEGRGMVSAAFNRRCDWLLIKAICDWGFGKNAVPGEKERDQQIAARNAADFVRYAVEQGLGGYAAHQRAARQAAGGAASPSAPRVVNHGTFIETLNAENVTFGVPMGGKTGRGSD